MNIFSIVELLTNSLDDNKSTDITTECGARIYIFPKLRSKFCFLTSTPTNMENILDAAKMSDTIIYVISSSSGISIKRDHLLDLSNVHCLSGSIIYSVVLSSNDDSMSTTTSCLSSSRNL